jgi:Pyruvate/2-oxoacid:ferredoxin oxidoreductase delta subunit
MHYVCTREELRTVIDAQKRFWVSNCGCREGKEGGCKRSRMDVCLMFADVEGSSGTGKREISRADVDAIMREAETKHLVTRPFRNEARTETEGSCFCCDDCCGYFNGDEYKCDKGAFIEVTEQEECADCGACVDVCYFKARTMVDDKLAVDREKCFGCGLCRDVCPTNCIEMSARG